jgi:poly(3-hydroxybutyrate) depolymerase
MAFCFSRLARRAMLLFALALLAGAQAQAQTQVQAGPGTWSGNQTWASDNVNGGALTGYYYWPSTAPRLAGKRALVLVLHGCAQTAAGDIIDGATDKGYNWKGVADQYGAVILAPNATGNLYGAHCWDWARSAHDRGTGHAGVLLDLVKRFVGNPQYAIDPQQVYVAGLSSGGAETMVLGCLAPDIFAGIGINAGPALGVTTAQIGSVPSGTSATTVANNCKALAGANAPQFATQVAGVVWGTNDYTVAQAYGPLDAAAMRLAYGGSFTKGAAATVPTGGSNVPYSDANGKVRTSEMTVTGMGHAWPAGTGGQGGNFVDATRVNYPAFVTDFWFNNNLRVARTAAPVMASCAAGVSGSTVTVNGAAGGATIGSYRVVLDGPTPVDDAAAGSGAGFSKAYTARADGYYSGSVTATDDSTGLTSGACAIAPFLVGTAPALQAPAGLALGGSSAGSITLRWNASTGAIAYNVYRSGSRVNAAAVTSTAYTDAGLAAATSYTYQVSAVGNGGVESARSAAVTGSTASGFACSATTSSNYAHVQAGRAHDSRGHALANGSNQDMGLDNTFYTATLAQTAAGYYVIGSCPSTQ